MVLLFLGHCMNSERKHGRILITRDHLARTYNYRYLGKHHTALIPATSNPHFVVSNIPYYLSKMLDWVISVERNSEPRLNFGTSLKGWLGSESLVKWCQQLYFELNTVEQRFGKSEPRFGDMCKVIFHVLITWPVLWFTNLTNIQLTRNRNSFFF